MISEFFGDVRVNLILLLSVATLALPACAPKASNSAAQLSIRIPSQQDFESRHQRVGGQQTYDFARACFAINVTASDIAATTGKSCDIPIGIFTGFVAPGGTLSLTVPHGTSRRLEVYSYLRNSPNDACPTKANLTGMDKTTIVEVGNVASFDTTQATVDLDVTLTNPAPNTNLVTQYSLPQTCVPPHPPSTATAAIANGHSVSSGGNYIAVGAVAGTKNEVQMHGGNYNLRLSRRAQ